VAVNIGRLGANVGALVGAGYARGERVLVLAGDDTASVGVVFRTAAVLRRGAPIGIVWIDAHGDFNTRRRRSQPLAGMPLAILAGWPARSGVRRRAGGGRIPTDRMVIAGVRELDDAEARLLRSTDVRVLRQEDASGAMSSPTRWDGWPKRSTISTCTSISTCSTVAGAELVDADPRGMSLKHSRAAGNDVRHRQGGGARRGRAQPRAAGSAESDRCSRRGRCCCGGAALARRGGSGAIDERNAASGNRAEFADLIGAARSDVVTGGRGRRHRGPRPTSGRWPSRASRCGWRSWRSTTSRATRRPGAGRWRRRWSRMTWRRCGSSTGAGRARCGWRCRNRATCCRCSCDAAGRGDPGQVREPDRRRPDTRQRTPGGAIQRHVRRGGELGQRGGPPAGRPHTSSAPRSPWEGGEAELRSVFVLHEGPWRWAAGIRRRWRWGYRWPRSALAGDQARGLVASMARSPRSTWRGRRAPIACASCRPSAPGSSLASVQGQPPAVTSGGRSGRIILVTVLACLLAFSVSLGPPAR